MNHTLKGIVGTTLATGALLAMSPEVSAKEEYTIQKGDTLFSIASKFNTTIDKLRKANNIKGDLILVGQRLIIPNDTEEHKETPITSNQEPIGIYKVVFGDTLNKIAQRFDTTVPSIRSLNNINGDLIFVGQELRIQGIAQEAEVPKEPVTQTEHIVVSGDTLYEIAMKYDITLAELRELNNIWTDFIYVGQRLVLTETADSSYLETPEAPKTDNSTYYTVQSGDWLIKIANKFNTDVASLRKLNHLTGDFIYVGQVLKVKDSKQADWDIPNPVVDAKPIGSVHDIIKEADSHLGIPYVWGGRTPSQGFDCSGFVQYVYKQARGVDVGAWTVPQENAGKHIAVEDAKIGDLLFWGDKGNTYHVAIYTGDNQFINAPRPGHTVSYSTISPYWYPSFAVSMASYH